MPISAPEISNPLFRDALNLVPLDQNRLNHVAGFIFPDVTIDAESTDYVIEAQHSLNLDALRGEDAEAKEVKFGEGATATISVVEYMQKSRIDKRRVEAYSRIGIDKITERADLHRGDILDIIEYLACAKATSTANFDADHRLAGGNFTNTGVKALFETARNIIVDEGGFDITGAVMGTGVENKLLANPDVKTWLGTGTNQVPSNASLQTYFNIPEIRTARYRRKIGNGTTASAFFPADAMLLFASRPVLSNRTFGASPVVPYGAAHNRAGVKTDVRVIDANTVEGQWWVAAAERTRPYIFNSNLAYLFTGVV